MLFDLLRPVCPNCDGAGGFMDGFFQPGCELCNPNEDNGDEVTKVWRWSWWLHRFRIWRLDRRLNQMMRQG